MRFADSYSHNDGRRFLDSVNLRAEIIATVNAPQVPVTEGGAARIRGHIASVLQLEGWAGPLKLEALGIEINAFKRGCALHTQTGNVTRAFYDLMKLQALYDHGRAQGGVLIVPTKSAAKRIGGARPEFERLQSELSIAFDRQITMPLFLVGFE